MNSDFDVGIGSLYVTLTNKITLFLLHFADTFFVSNAFDNLQSRYSYLSTALYKLKHSQPVGSYIY